MEVSHTDSMVTQIRRTEAREGIPASESRDVEIERSIAAHLLERFGPMLTFPQVAEVLDYPSADALERSIQRGHIELMTLKLPHRRGTFMLAHDLAHYLAAIERKPGSRPATPGGLRKERECR